MSWASQKKQQSQDQQSSIYENSQNDSPQELPNQDNEKVEIGQKSYDQLPLNHENQTSQDNLSTDDNLQPILCFYKDDGSISQQYSFNDESNHKNHQVEINCQACSSPYMNEGNSQSNQDQFIIIYDQTSQTPQNIEYISNPNPIIPTSPQAEQQFYPKVTKNYYKCIHGALQKFMKDIQDNIQFTCKAKKFLESNPNVSGKLKLIRSIKSCQQMRSIAMKFLLDFQWCRYLVKNNRVDIERYFRLNQMLIQQIQE